MWSGWESGLIMSFMGGGLDPKGLRNLRRTCPTQNDYRCRCHFCVEEAGEANLWYVSGVDNKSNDINLGMCE